MYPIQRNRRLRSSATLRALVQEYHLNPSDFIVPLFVIEGTQKKKQSLLCQGIIDYPQT